MQPLTPEQKEPVRKLAHDLRNDLSILYSYSQVLELTLTGASHQKERDILKSMNETIQGMNESIKTRIDAL